MSSPTTNPVAWHEASSYATAVRHHLDDLAPDVVEELAGGLEADLLDQASESSVPLAQRLGDPAGYAAELRAAAGLAPRTAPPRREGLRTSLRQNLDENLAGLRRQTWWPRAASIAADLRPLWWVVRAWVAFAVVVDVVVVGYWHEPLPWSFGSWLLLLILVAGSVALGRGLWRSVPAVRGATVVGNVLAALMLLPVLAWVDDDRSLSYSDPVVEEAYAPTGLVADGRTVTNVFPYGPDGEPLQGVTLLDQDGQPIGVSPEQMPGDEGYDDGRLRVQVPNWTADGDPVWNVFPMGTASVDAEEFYSRYYSDLDAPGSLLRPPYRAYEEAAPPRVRVPAVLVDPSRALRPGGATPPTVTPPPTTTPPTTTPPTTNPAHPTATATPPATPTP